MGLVKLITSGLETEQRASEEAARTAPRVLLVNRELHRRPQASLRPTRRYFSNWNGVIVTEEVGKTFVR